MSDIQRSISSLRQRKAGQQVGAKAALQRATTEKRRAELIEDQLETTAVTLDCANNNYSGHLTQTEARIAETRHRVQIVTARYSDWTRRAIDL